METTNTRWAAAPCARTADDIAAHAAGGFGMSAAFDGTAVPMASLTGIVRKPATVDARYDAQGALPAWSPPV